MTIYYSKITNGFYDSEIHSVMPADCLEISDELRWELVNGQSSGQIISTDIDGLPILIDPPAITSDELACSIRTRRDILLSDTDWVVLRSLETGLPSPDNYRTYRQSLRDITKQPDFPTSVVWPELT